MLVSEKSGLVERGGELIGELSGRLAARRGRIMMRRPSGGVTGLDLRVLRPRGDPVSTASKLGDDESRTNIGVSDGEEIFDESRLAASAVGAMSTGVLVLDARGRVRFCNAAAMAALDLTRDEVSGRAPEASWRACRQRATGHDGAPLRAEDDPVERTLETGKACSGAVIGIRSRRGAPGWFSVSAQPLTRAEEGTAGSVLVTLTDVASVLQTAEEEKKRLRDEIRESVADHQQIASELAQSRESLAEAQRIAHLGSWDWNLATNELRWSDEIYRLFGLPPQSFGATYEAFLDRVHPDDRPAVRAAVDRALLGAEPYEINHRIILPDGAERIVHERAEVTRDPERRPLRMIGTVHDVTDQRVAERALRRERDFITAVLDTIGAIVVVLDSEGRIIRFNRACEQTTGYAAAEVMGRTALDLFVPPEERPAVRMERARILAGRSPSTFENEWVMRDGRRRLIAWSNTALSDAAGRVEHVISTGIDVTALRESERKLALTQFAVDNAASLVFWADAGGRILYANGAAGKSLGGAPEDLLGRNVAEILDRPSWAAHWSDVGRDSGLRFEAAARTRKGEVLPLEVYAQRSAFRGSEYYFCFARDITERKRADAELARLLASEQRARAEAEQASRSKDLFLATLSHELRTPLTTVLMWAQLLRRGAAGDPEKLSRGLAHIERSAQAQTRIVDDLLDVSRIVTGKMSIESVPLNPLDVVNAAVETVRPAADAKSIPIEVMAEPGIGLVSGDPVRLQQVLWNLLANAVKFTPKKGSIEVRLSRICHRGERMSWVGIAVADSGQGIRRDYLPHLFRRFSQADSSATRAYGGLGLGLAISASLVELHGGTIRAESPGEGRGSTFTVELPAIGDAEVVRRTTEGREAVDEREIAGTLAGIRVLVVDDDPPAREVIAELLSTAGAEVKAVTSAAEGMEALRAFRPDALVSDIAMPVEDGHSLLRRIRALDPRDGSRTPALALTAYAGKEARELAAAAGYQAYMAKPVRALDLVRAVARLTGRASPS